MKIFTLLITLSVLLLCCSPKSEVPKESVDVKNVTSYTIEQFYKNTRIGGGIFSPDEKKLLIHSDESGIFNLYEIDLDSLAKTQITASTVESFFAIGYIKDTNKLLYSADKGGNELSHIYALSIGDSVGIDLTPGENEKADFAGWTRDKKSFYFVSNKRDAKFFDLYKMDVATFKSTLVYQNNDGLDISGISDDESYLAIAKTITTSEEKLFLVDKKAKKQIEISDSSAKGNYRGAGFSRDNKFFYYITNANKEFAYLVEYEIATAARKTIYETNWDVMYTYLSENEKYRVIAVNEDGKNILLIKNQITGTDVDVPVIPDGDIKGVSISETESKMILTVGTSKAPSDFYSYVFDTKELKKITKTLNPEINPDDLVSAEVVRFKSFDGLEIPAIYYKPLNANADNKVPALVWVHGGPGGQTRVGYFSLIQYLVNHGYAILAVNNRGSSGYGKSFYKMDDKNHGDKDLKDCVYGKQWLATQDYIDADKIGIIGGSYGGYMTMAAMTFVPDTFKVGVNIFGVTNWLRTLKSVPPYWESFRKALYEELGDPNTADSVRLYNISPLFHAHNVKNPVMVLQGANDPRVLKIESDEIVEAIKKNNVPVEYLVFQDEGHGFVKKENEIKAYGQVLVFLDKYLKQK